MSEIMAPETTSFLERATRDPTIDVGKLEQLIALQERVADREARRRYAEDMNALQAEMPQVARGGKNPFFNSRYATYEDIDTVIRPYYTKHGFSTGFRIRPVAGGRISVRCVVKHTGGHEEDDCELESGIGGGSSKAEVQNVGSVTSYLKRYTLCAAFGVALKDDETDDDGGEGTRREKMTTMERRDVKREETKSAQSQGEIWLAKLERACAIVRDPAEIDQIAAKQDATLAGAPPWVQEEAKKIYATHKARLAPSPESKAIGDGPIDDDDGELDAEWSMEPPDDEPAKGEPAKGETAKGETEHV